MPKMFIKIKIEPRGDQEVDENNFKPSSFFEVDDESTICEVKLRIEKYIEVPAERQEIRTLTQTLGDDEKLADIGELMRSTGSSIMLYIYTAGAYEEQHAEEPIFHAFLQLYTADEAAVQQNYEKQLKNSVHFANHEPASVTSTITLVGDSGSEDEDVSEVNSSSLSSDSSSESDSGSSSENTEQESTKPTECRKRHNKEEQNDIKEKRAKRYTVLSKISSEVTKYLDEFPKYAQKTNCTGAEKNTAAKQACADTAQVSMTTSTSDSKQSNDTVVVNENYTPQVEAEARKKPGGSPSTTTEDKEPCATIMPEQRAFIAILSNIDEGKQIEKNECIELLAAFFDIFKSSENSAELKFNGKSGPILYKGRIWLPCQDEQTMTWTLAKSNSVSAIHKAHKFSDYFNLKKYQVIIPSVAKTKNLFDIFDLIEQQNSGIKTTKWSVLERHSILNDKDEFYDKCVSCLCPNEVLFLGLDPQTLNTLERNNYTLNYCFWKLSFEPITNNS